PLRVPEAGLFVVTLGTKPLEDIQETGAALGLFDGQHAVVQAARAARITGQRQDLQDRRQPLLSRRDARRALGEPARHRLPLPVETGGNVRPTLVHLQDAYVAQAEARALTDLDVVAAGGRVGDDAVVEHDTNHAIPEQTAQTLVQDRHRLGGFHVPWRLRPQLRVVELRQDVVQVVRHIAHLGRAIREAVAG